MKPYMTVFLFLFVCLSFPASANEVLEYRMTKKGETEYWEYRIEQTTGGFTITSSANSWYVNRDFEQLRWEHRGKKTDIAAERTGNGISLNGTFKGKKTAKKYTVNDYPWYQCIHFSLEAFVRSEKAEDRFWTINSNDLSIYEFEAKRMDVETIEINGVPAETIHVRIRPSGFAGNFWHGDYWYRKSDFRYVRFKAVQGPPGSPVAVVELVSEGKNVESEAD
ncbi:MAG: hypothetical protein JW881_20900 [Spirochaetales bacterium]|nr:hypothetical protein [Spirochaetales bacterium]